MIPIRCFSCNKIIANKWQKYKSLINSGMSAVDALTEVGLRLYCCKRMFLGHVEIIDKLILYTKTNNLTEKKHEK